MHAINSKLVEEVMLGMSIGSQVRHARRVKGLTQEELAVSVGTRQPGIARIEDDNYLPSLSMLAKIAKALGKRVQVKLK